MVSCCRQGRECLDLTSVIVVGLILLPFCGGLASSQTRWRVEGRGEKYQECGDWKRLLHFPLGSQAEIIRDTSRLLHVLRGGGKKFLERKISLKNWQTQLWQYARDGKSNEVESMFKGKPLGVADAADPEKGWTALHWAAASGHEQVIEALIAAGATIDARDKQGATPLHWAAALGRSKVLSMLEKKGANLLSTDKAGRTPLGVAVKHQQEFASEFLKRSAARKYKTLSEIKKTKWRAKLKVDHIGDGEMERLLRAVTPKRAKEIRLGALMMQDLDLPHRPAKMLL